MFSVPFISLGGLIRNGCESDKTGKQSSYIRAVTSRIELRSQPRSAFVAIGIFLFFGMAMAALAGTTLVWPGTPLDRIWLLNPRAHFQLASLGPRVGLAFLLLSLALGTAAIGWFQKRRWGWRLAVCIIGIQVLGDLVNIMRGDFIRGVPGAVIAGALLIYLCRATIKELFN
jgi:hypothetical protein